MPNMAETKDTVQLRLLSLELLKQLWAGHEAMCQSVTRVASESNLDYSSSSNNLEMPLSQETSASSVAPSSQDKRHVWDPLDGHRGDTYDVAWYGKVNSRVDSLPPATCQHQEPQEGLRPSSVPLLATEGRKRPVSLGGPKGLGPDKAQVPRSLPLRLGKLSKPKVTFSQESSVPESSWCSRPCLDHDWTTGSLDSSSPVSSESEAYFSMLQKFREDNREDCVCNSPEAVFPELQESNGVEEDHECVYCYRINRRLFPEPLDPGAPCRLCGIPRDEQGPQTLVDPVQVRVSVPLSIMDPPHQYRIHRRKSFDASDTFALPRHCLLGWDILPPKSEKTSVSKNLDLWSSVSHGAAQRRNLSATNPSCQAVRSRVPPPFWSEPQVARLCPSH